MAVRYTDGPQAAIALLDHDDESSSEAAGDRTTQLYRGYGRLLLAIGTPAETEARRR